MSRLIWIILQSVVIGGFIALAFVDDLKDEPKSLLVFSVLGWLIAEALTRGITLAWDWMRFLPRRAQVAFVIAQAAGLSAATWSLSASLGQPATLKLVLLVLGLSLLASAIVTPAIIMSWRGVAPIVLKLFLRDVREANSKSGSPAASSGSIGKLP
jgi:hypothetical protein